MANLVHTVKIDEVGKTINFTLEDANGTVVLTPYTITMNLKKGSTLVTSGASVTKSNQTTAPGECYHTWAANTIPDTPGTYKGELKLEASGQVRYWPVNKDKTRTYFEVIVQNPLDT